MIEGYGWGYTKRYFDRLLWLSYSGWAWEFKRRDPALIRINRLSRTRPIILRRNDGVSLVRLPRPCPAAADIGLHYLPDPRFSAYETPLFWSPDVMTASLDAAAAMRAHLDERDLPLSWRDIPGKKTILMTPGHPQKLAVTARGYAAQLAIEPSSPPLPIAIYLTLQMKSGLKLLENLRCLDLFARHCAGLELDIAPRRGLSPARLRQTLVALDGWLAGGSQREIGRRIFGGEIVERDWNDGVHSYKSRVRRLIKKGRDLMKDGYLKLL